MSGGSYDSLYLAEPEDLVAFGSKWTALEKMQQRLAGLDYAQDAAAETYALMQIVKQAAIRIGVHQDRLQGIFQAVERWDSGDSGETELRVALASFRSGLTVVYRFMPDQNLPAGHNGQYVVSAGKSEVFRTGDQAEAIQFMTEHTAEEFGTA